MPTIHTSDHGSALRLAPVLAAPNALWSLDEHGSDGEVTLVDTVSGSVLVLHADGTAAFLYGSDALPRAAVVG